MRFALERHPESPCDAVTAIAVEAACTANDRLALRYLVSGRTADLLLPPTAAATRGDRLWERTCFEAFIRASSGTAYHELNLSPSTRWAAYRFDGYRSGMTVARQIGPPRIEVESHDDRFELRALLSLEGASDLPRDADWRLGLAAVIEERRGRKSYWALAHPPGAPDFHHSDCFVQELPPAWRA